MISSTHNGSPQRSVNYCLEFLIQILTQEQRWLKSWKILGSKRDSNILRSQILILIRMIASKTSSIFMNHDVLESDSELSPARPKPENHVTKTITPMKPTFMNAFDIISLSKGFNLSGLFEEDDNHDTDTRFTTQKPPDMVISKLEELAHHESFKVKKKDGNVKLQCIKGGRKGQLAIDAEFFEVAPSHLRIFAPSYHIIDVKKRAGDTLEYKKFCDRELRPSLKDIIWTCKENEQETCSTSS